MSRYNQPGYSNYPDYSYKPTNGSNGYSDPFSSQPQKQQPATYPYAGPAQGFGGPSKPAPAYSMGGYSSNASQNYSDPYSRQGGTQHPNNQFGGYSIGSQTNPGSKNNYYQPNPVQPVPGKIYAPNGVNPAPMTTNLQDVNQQELEAKAKLGKDLFKEALDKTATTSAYETVMARLQRKGETFRDLEFTPNLQSLTGGDASKASKWASVVWRTPKDFCKSQFVVFDENIEPNDISQGQLGDCYFLSTLSAMAEYPDRITKLFPNKEPNPYGCYMVKICDMGEWKEIIVDDLFPCKNNRSGPIFTRGKNNELWVLILEKAWAKLYGSYAKIEAGLTREVLHDLTGAPTEYFLTQSDDPEKIWDALEKGDKEGFIMTAGSGDFFDGADLLSSSGLVGSHAYSLISAITVPNGSSSLQLLKLRNPWGESEWKGDWSDHSSLWTEELKKICGWVDADDGDFFMTFEDFCKYFTDVQICRVHDDYQYSVHKTNVDPRHAVYLRFTINKTGHHYITINQKSKRFFKETDSYQYSDVFLIVGREVGNGEYEYVEGNQRADREVWMEGEFTEGDYVAYVKIPWYDQQAHDVTISAYGYSTVDFQEVPKAAEANFLEKVYTHKALNSGKLKSYQQEGELNVFKFSELTDDGFGYFFFWNRSESTLNTEVYFKLMSGIKLRKPFAGKSFKITVAPGENQIVLTKVNPYYEVKQVYSEIATFQRNDNQLKKIAKEKGQRKQRKHHKTGEMLDIWCYILQHSDGIFFYYENKTNQYLLDEEVKFKLQGLKIESDPLNSSVKFALPPGQTKEIKLKKTLNEFSIGFSTAYLIKNANP